MRLEQMAQGAAAAATLAAEVNARRAAAGVASRIRVLDVGGGLPVGWGGTQGPSWQEYPQAGGDDGRPRQPQHRTATPATAMGPPPGQWRQPL